MRNTVVKAALICLTLWAGVISGHADLKLQSTLDAACRPASATTVTIQRWKPQGACTNDCFVSRLSCSNGRAAELRSNIHPGTTELQFAFRDWAPWSFAGYLLPFIVLIAVATIGSGMSVLLLGLNGFFLIYAGGAAWSLYASIIGDPSSEWLLLQRVVFLNPWVFGTIIGLFALSNLRPILRGLEHLFYRHPDDHVMLPVAFPMHPLQAAAMHAALMPSIYEFVDPRETTSHYHRETERLHAFKERLDAETAFAQAVIRRERTRNHLNDER